MQVRRATDTDIPSVLALERLVFSDAWGERDLREHLDCVHLSFFVCERDGEVLGYLLGSHIPPEGEIFRVATHPAHRKSGIGDTLSRAFLDTCDVAFLEVRRSNLAARALYEKLGLSLTGERKKYYKDPTEDECLYTLVKNEDHRL